MRRKQSDARTAEGYYIIVYCPSEGLRFTIEGTTNTPTALTNALALVRATGLETHNKGCRKNTLYSTAQVALGTTQAPISKRGPKIRNGARENYLELHGGGRGAAQREEGTREGRGSFPRH